MISRLLAAALVALAAAVPLSAEVSPGVAAGIAWMHSFEYERALAAFVRAERDDPRDALAYWGQAMCYEQFLWGNENVEEARAILARMRRRGALERASARDRAWLAALEPLFGDGNRTTRIQAYAGAMAAVAAAHPEDLDAAAFHGLAIMATRSRGLAGHQSHEPSLPELAGSAEQAQAAEIFTRILAKAPAHAGALHYLIHAWDDPQHAHKAIDAARAYATVVPESSHARHMPAHIFVQLGMWEDAIASDEAAAAAAEAHAAREKLPVTATDFHPLSWLVYEYTQAGRFDDARRAVQRLQGPAEATRDPRLLSLLATLRSRIAVEAEDWNALRGPSFSNYDELFAVGFSAAQRGDVALADTARVRIEELARQPRYAGRRAVLEIMALQVGAAIRVRNADLPGALELLKEATARERALPSPVGPPALMKPAQEQYAEALLAAGRVEEARAQFEDALSRTRNRRSAVAGLARAVTPPRSAGIPFREVALGTSVLLLGAAIVVWRRRTRAA